MDQQMPIGPSVETDWRPDFSVAISRAVGMIIVVDIRDMTVGDGADLELFVDTSQLRPRARRTPRAEWTLSGHLR
jgi:hypothetical protein